MYFTEPELRRRELSPAELKSWKQRPWEIDMTDLPLSPTLFPKMAEETAAVVQWEHSHPTIPMRERGDTGSQ